MPIAHKIEAAEIEFRTLLQILSAGMTRNGIILVVSVVLTECSRSVSIMSDAPPGMEQNGIVV
jgi:hypothetical protein